MFFYDVWLAQNVGNVKQFISLFKQRVNYVFVQNWNADLRDSSRATFYRTISFFDLQPYLYEVH